MTWKTLADALETAIAKGFEFGGDGAVDAAPAIPKSAGAEAPAKVRDNLPGTPGDSLPANKGHTDRCMDRAIPTSMPRSARSIHLCVDNEGGRQAREEVREPAGRLRDGGRGDRVRKLRLVAG